MARGSVAAHTAPQRCAAGLLSAPHEPNPRARTQHETKWPKCRPVLFPLALCLRRGARFIPLGPCRLAVMPQAPFSSLEEGVEVVGVISDCWLYHGIQVDFGAEFDGCAAALSASWEGGGPGAGLRAERSGAH